VRNSCHRGTEPQRKTNTTAETQRKLKTHPRTWCVSV
jgi:hypothetical protein